MAITKIEGGSVIITAPHIPVFQLIQWKHAVKLEGAGIRVARRSVTAHVKRVFGIKGPMKREDLVAEIQRRIDAYMAAHPASEGEAAAPATEVPDER